MPTEVIGAKQLSKALKAFTPDLAKEMRKELANLLKPIVKDARGFIPSDAPLSGWGKTSENARFPEWDSRAANAGIGYKTSPSKPNRQGFRALARIVNVSAAGTIYETAGRVHPNGREQNPIVKNYRYGGTQRGSDKRLSQSSNPGAGNMFIEAINQYGEIVDASNQTGAGRRTRKMRGRAIFRAWKEDGGRTNGAVLQAIDNAKLRFYKEIMKGR